MKYHEALQYLDKLELFGIKLGLENITKLCGRLENPQLAYKTLHIAGTNGKGSVAAMCSAALKEAGYSVGLYTSPHMQTFRERMRVNGKLISEEETAEVFEEVKKEADKMEKEGRKATYFEFVTAMAFLYFAKKKCDYAVVEAGMGGRLDATNVVSPEIAVITNIGFEHQQYLGNTKEKIANEKAGIIKENIRAVLGETDTRILKLLLKACKERNCKATAVKGEYRGKVSLPGKHQKRNAAIAHEAMKELGISENTTASGIAKAEWPGRLEVMQEKPLVMIDGAHNPKGVQALADYLKEQGKEVILVLGISSDKDITGIARIIAPLAKRITVTKAKYRGADCEEIRREVEKYCKDVRVTENARKAVEKAVAEAKDEIVMATGSLFVVGEARGLWKKEE